MGNYPQSEVESSIKEEVLQTFDHSEAKNNLTMVQREAKLKERGIDELLEGINAMCQQAMNPTMREVKDREVLIKEDYEDVFTLFVSALNKHRLLNKIKDSLMDYFKPYQRAYGLFQLDFTSFKKAVTMMSTNSQQYFEDAILKNTEPAKSQLALGLIKLKAGLISDGAKEIKNVTDMFPKEVYKYYPIKVTLKESLFNSKKAQKV